jgi:hypothetical protein
MVAPATSTGRPSHASTFPGQIVVSPHFTPTM